MEQFWYLILNNDGTPHHSLQPTCTHFDSRETIEDMKFAIRDENIATMTMVCVEAIAIYRSRSEYESGKEPLTEKKDCPCTTQDSPVIVLLPELKPFTPQEFASKRLLDMESSISARFFLSKTANRIASVFWFLCREKTPSFMDVVRARRGRENIDWKFIGTGTRMSLPDALAKEDWKFLLKLNRMTNRQLHCAELSRDHNGQEFVRIHCMSDYSNEEMINRSESILRGIFANANVEVHITSSVI
jgi:hypothetical protein